MKGFVKHSYVVGEWLIKLLQLQVLWFFYVLKGGIIFGIFPATAAVFRILYEWIDSPKEEVELKLTFRDFYQQNFWEVNKLGGGFALLFGMISIDLYISRLYIQSVFVHGLLVVILVIVLGVSLYLFPVYSRYQLTLLGYVKQASLYFFTNILETVAMLLGFMLLIALITFLPILLFAGGVPLLAFPSSWFAYQGMKKIELKKETA